MTGLMFGLLFLAIHLTLGQISYPCGPCSCFRRGEMLYADCTNRDLSGIPPGVPREASWLDLSGNNLTELSPYQFKSFETLRYLNLSNNQLEEADDLAFIGLGNLHFLRLDDNFLHYGNLNNSKLFKPLRNLTYLNISSNNFILITPYSQYPDKALKYLNKLEVLQMDGLPKKNLGPGFSRLKNLVELNLSGACSLLSLYNDTFQYVPQLRVLILNDCHLSSIYPDSISHMTNLTYIDVSNNKGLGMEGIRNLTYELQNKPLRYLYMNSVVPAYSVCVILKDEFIRNLNNTNLRVFSADDNYIEKFGDNALPYFPTSLINLSLRENKFTFGPYIKYIQVMKGLEEVDLSGIHRAHEFPYFRATFQEVSNFHQYERETNIDDCDDDCYSPSISSIPSPKLTLMDGVHIPVPPNLKNITYSYSQLPYHIGNMKIGNNTLLKVDVSSNILSTWSGPVTGLENLKHLDLSNNLAKHIYPRFFHTFPGLEILNVSDNFMGFVLNNDTNGTVFMYQANLKVLDLRSNFISQLDKSVFRGLVSLETLYLQGNNIHPYFSVDIRNMMNLTLINLRNNQIRWFDKDVIDAINHIATGQNVSLDLSQNPIACTCYNLEFLSWINNPKPNLHFVNIHHYFCMFSSGKNQSLADFQTVYEELKNSCNTYFGLSLGLVAAVALVFCIIIVGILYRYRWKLRYVYYAARLKYSKLTERVDDGNFEFDAFVSFAEEDRDFVVNDLWEKLENEAGLNLNLHQRNFRPGRPIASNIVDAVKNSRKTLVLLSKAFLDSYWCIYELNMAKMESFDTGRDVLVVVMFEQIPPKDIPPEIQCHLQKDSYLEYPTEGNKDVFWKTLIESLNR